MTPPEGIKLSFCTTCANRVVQLRQTFAANAEVVARHPDVEWIIVNFNSQDDLDPFMTSQLASVSPRITYARDLSQRPWHVSYAKNVAHRLGRGEILVSLDCDNFIGNAVETIKVHFASGYKLVHMWSGVLGDGTYGRVAIDKRLFHALGGYDESFYPMGYQDFDIIRRATAIGVPQVRQASGPGLAIKNTKEESVRHCAQKGMTWDDYNRLNRARSIANVTAGRLVANAPQGWAELKVETFHGTGVGTTASPAMAGRKR